MGFGVVILTDLPFHVRTGGVEVTQRDAIEIIGMRIVARNLLADKLGATIGVDRRLQLAFRNRDRLGHAVSRAAAGKDQPADLRLAHCAQQRRGALDVVAIVFFRFGD
jgi:hypothetical protein